MTKGTDLKETRLLSRWFLRPANQFPTRALFVVGVVRSTV